jgi:hypothetical protein
MCLAALVRSTTNSIPYLTHEYSVYKPVYL